MSDSEKVLQNKLIEFLKRYFYVYSEVYSEDNSARIDLILIHHSDKERKYPIGVEIKEKGKKTGKGLAEWLKQSHRYAGHKFKGFGKCLIITCPQVSGFYFREGVEMHNHEIEGDYGEANNVGTFLGQWQIGEMQKFEWHGKKLFRIVYKGFIIWTMKDNILRMHNYERLCK